MAIDLRAPLAGVSVQLVPYSSAQHASALYRLSHGPEAADLWRYLPIGPFPSEAEFLAAVAVRDTSLDPQFYTLLSPTREVLGTFALMRIEPAHRVIEVGHVLYPPVLQRSIAGTEAMYLLARHVFDTLGYRRFEWKCNNANEASKRAALRYGFTFEGVFRQHMIVKGQNRDTAWYSLLDSEWPRAKEAFERWLDPSNFDASGRQRQRLGDIRAAL